MSHLNQTITIITGASSGIGAATARRLAAAGTHVVLAARSEDKLQALTEEIRADGHQASYRVTDVSDASDVRALVDGVLAEHGHIDVLVNNAGLMLFSYWKDVAVDDWDKMIDTNIRGYLNAIAAVLPSMLERGSGHILNMSSVAAHNVGKASGVYSATKFFIRGITDSLRTEIGVDNGIQVSMVSPGVIDTGWAEKVNDSTGKDIATELNDVAITPEQVAGAVLYALDQPSDVTVNDVVIHPTRQPW